ncbi:hypothetical protein [Streptomyces nogalater]|uniref:Uncharacterized protein n=1 Tax=Streptomyces nogalater TaxID=38314 RepID=A0ABW0WFA7_STRNO
MGEPVPGGHGGRRRRRRRKARRALHSLTAGDIPAPHRDRVPEAGDQVQELKHLREPNQLRRLEQAITPRRPCSAW